MNYNIIRIGLIAVTASVALAGCLGDSGNDDNAAPGYMIETAAAPPDSAGSSISGFLAFIVDMGKANLEGREPYDLAAFNGPSETSDTTEPVATSIDQ
jgi:hypothetical protein